MSFRVVGTRFYLQVSKKLNLYYIRLGPYYKSKLELKSNSSEILPVNCKFICVYIILLCAESQT